MGCSLSGRVDHVRLTSAFPPGAVVASSPHWRGPPSAPQLVGLSMRLLLSEPYKVTLQVCAAGEEVAQGMKPGGGDPEPTLLLVTVLSHLGDPNVPSYCPILSNPWQGSQRPGMTSGLSCHSAAPSPPRGLQLRPLATLRPAHQTKRRPVPVGGQHSLTSFHT